VVLGHFHSQIATFPLTNCHSQRIYQKLQGFALVGTLLVMALCQKQLLKLKTELIEKEHEARKCI